jgi:hypothetical protein
MRGDFERGVTTFCREYAGTPSGRSERSPAQSERALPSS